MAKNAKLQDEAGRMAALQRYDVLDTPQEEAFDRITALVATIFRVPICTVSLVDTDRQWFKSSVGLPRDSSSREESFCTHTIQQNEPLLVPDAALDPGFSQKACVTGSPFLRSYLGVPLASPDGYNVGSLCVMDLVPHSYTPEQIEILKSFAALIVDELEMRRIAQTDHLTGVATRRSFTLEMEKAMARQKRSGTPAALVLLDIDHFKKVNDTYGHPAGDLVLKSVAGCLQSLLRQGDLAGRLGGEEFGVLLQDASEQAAAETAERLRAQLETMTVEHDPPLRVTASFGVAALKLDADSVKQWMAAADELLYAAKRSGRNRCCCAAAVMPVAYRSE